MRVNAVAPGAAETDGHRGHVAPDIVEASAAPGHWASTADADEIASAVDVPASPAASYVNGAVLTIGGGAQSIKAA